MSYIILDVKSGEMDGYYADYTNEDHNMSAVGMLWYHKKRKPDGHWIIVKVISKHNYPIKKWSDRKCIK